MQFLLGPAGSGKTFRCLAEIRAALREDFTARPLAAPEQSGDAPLILLAPKQATFQLERQLLADPALCGYTRLRIFSFERLAQFVLDECSVSALQFLRDEGRVMVLRALLLRHANDLKLFRGSARRPGFAQELNGLVNELQQHQVTAGKLRSSMSQTSGLHRELREKLHDLALMLEAFDAWLNVNELKDGNHLLEAAIVALKDQFKIKKLKLKINNLWLDGFAEMTPQEMDLLAAVLPLCDRATLAFCLDESGSKQDEFSWLSIWSAVGKTFQQCRQRLEALPGCEISIESLKRNPGKNRFLNQPALQQMEASWSRPQSSEESSAPDLQSAISLVACLNMESEAILAAREILKFVRQPGNRFRDCAVLVRDLASYHKPLQRVFHRYEIPGFLDRRESVAHHPLAELTRGALRTITFNWQQDDWFAALKAGFAPVTEEAIDRLENAALEFGWRGKKWREPLPDEASEQVRQVILPPFEILHKRLDQAKYSPNGGEIAKALRELWHNLKVEQTLERWTLDTEHPAIHSTVWEQMNAWLDDVALAFANVSLPLRDWLPILEAGLANLTVGVIPPALDQVLIGAIDRARNPDLKLALVLGFNETIFPAAPATPTILTDADRSALSIPIGPDLRERLARERYYGYIACTRASERLVMTYAHQDVDGKVLNPSPFVAHVKRIFPSLTVEEFSGEPDWRDARHTSELIVPLMEMQRFTRGEVTDGQSNQSDLAPVSAIKPWSELCSLPVLKMLAENLAVLREPDQGENLSPALAEKLYGPVLRSSVSRLEEFAACPFRFFVRSGLRAGERKVFELDARERGNFQHDVLKMFHEQLKVEGRRWRDLEPAEASERIGKIAAAQMKHFRDGLFRDSAETVFAARTLTESLQDFVSVIVAWMRTQYEFDPAEAELGFGGKDDPTPAWEIELAGGHKLALQGRIDRVDLWRDPAGDTTMAVVTDYKSGGKKLEKVLVENGVQLQLIAYLGALRHWKNPGEIFGHGKIIPAGAFYVNLRGEYKGGGSRDEILAAAAESRRQAYRHTGRFDAGLLNRLDRIHAKDQFNYRLKNNGELFANSTEALPRTEFESLLDGVETQLRTLGERIFSGAAQVDPYRIGKRTPCEYCDYQAACRIDKWTHQYRVLRAEKVAEA